MDERETWQGALERARLVLAKLEEQVAGYTALSIPAHLAVELEEQREKVARLEALVSGQGERWSDTLPRREMFFGREKEVARAMAALSPEERCWGLLVDGIGGIGKTALAVEVAYRCRDEGLFDIFLFTTAKQTRLEPGGEQRIPDTATTLDAMLSELARALGEVGVTQLGGAEKQRGLQEALRRLGRRTLLVLDNLETLSPDEQTMAEEFLRRLPDKCKAIVTSRRRTGEGAVWLRLEKLGWPAARQLIAAEMGRAANLAAALDQAGEARWQELYDEAGGSPLALRWTLGLMRARNLSLDRALELLRGRAGADSPLHEFIYREARREMGADDWRVLGALSLFAAPASFAALVAASGLTRQALEAALERLHAFSLVDVPAPDGPYSLHPLTRRLAADELAAQPDMADVLERRFTDYWLDYAKLYGSHGYEFEDHVFILAPRLEAEWPNLEAAAIILRDRAGPPDFRNEEPARMLVTLSGALSFFLWSRGYWDEQLRLAECAYVAARFLDDWVMAGWHANDMVWIYRHRGEIDQAATWTERMATAMQHGGTRQDQVAAIHMRGLIAERRGDLAEAERFYNEALAAYHDLVNETEEAVVLQDLGDVARKHRNYERAEACYRQALVLAEKTGKKILLLWFANKMGILNLDRGTPSEARPWFEQALALGREMGHQEWLAHSWAGLACVLEAGGCYVEALPRAEEALRIYERLRHQDLEQTRELVARLREKARAIHG